MEIRQKSQTICPKHANCLKQYPKFPTGHYPDRVDFPDWTISRLDYFPTGHFPDWTHSRPDTFPTIIFPTGHYPDWTHSRLDTFPTRHIPD
uniref:Uncharacterized protein n=1 Tax=Acrobeloides nanus TaxID=290746 RepID=A0A914BUN8_9BILA